MRGGAKVSSIMSSVQADMPCSLVFRHFEERKFLCPSKYKCFIGVRRGRWATLLGAFLRVIRSKYGIHKCAKATGCPIARCFFRGFRPLSCGCFGASSRASSGVVYGRLLAFLRASPGCNPTRSNGIGVRRRRQSCIQALRRRKFLCPSKYKCFIGVRRGRWATLLGAFLRVIRSKYGIHKCAKATGCPIARCFFRGFRPLSCCCFGVSSPRFQWRRLRPSPDFPTRVSWLQSNSFQWDRGRRHGR